MVWHTGVLQMSLEPFFRGLDSLQTEAYRALHYSLQQLAYQKHPRCTQVRQHEQFDTYMKRRIMLLPKVKLFMLMGSYVSISLGFHYSILNHAYNLFVRSDRRRSAADAPIKRRFAITISANVGFLPLELCSNTSRIVFHADYWGFLVCRVEIPPYTNLLGRENTIVFTSSRLSPTTLVFDHKFSYNKSQRIYELSNTLGSRIV